MKRISRLESQLGQNRVDEIDEGFKACIKKEEPKQLIAAATAAPDQALPEKQKKRKKKS